MSKSLRPHGLWCPWNSLGQNTGVGNLSLLQGIFLTQGLNPGLPHCRCILDQLSHKGSPWKTSMPSEKSAVIVALISRSYLSYPLDMSIFTPSSPEWSVGLSSDMSSLVMLYIFTFRPPQPSYCLSVSWGRFFLHLLLQTSSKLILGLQAAIDATGACTSGAIENQYFCLKTLFWSSIYFSIMFRQGSDLTYSPTSKVIVRSSLSHWVIWKLFFLESVDQQTAFSLSLTPTSCLRPRIQNGF